MKGVDDIQRYDDQMNFMVVLKKGSCTLFMRLACALVYIRRFLLFDGYKTLYWLYHVLSKVTYISDKPISSISRLVATP